MIRWESISKKFGESTWAVQDVSLECGQGSLLVLVGPSGCGKTTLLRMLAGLETPTGGKLVIDGQDVTHAAPSARDVAMVFQSYALYPHMTVSENMSFGLRLRKVAKTERENQVREAADLLGLTPYLNRKPKALSGGQRQRVALGRALVRRPKVFLLDEPLSNLDASLRVTMRKEIKELQRRLKATMVYVTHDQTEAMTLADTLAVMNNGELQQVDSPMNVYKEPANVFVASFIGSPAMNLIKGTAQGGSFSSGDFVLPARDVSGSVTLGVRPEHVELGGNHQQDSRFKIQMLEALGSEILVHGHVDGTPLVSRVHGDAALSVGDSVAWRVSRPHWFDTRTGARLENRT